MSRPAYYKLVAQTPSRYQVLCANCNWIKRFEMGEQPPRA
jgi:RNase P subunit RPR2